MDAAFLQPQAVSDAVRDLLASAKHAKLAVSFWGRSAVAELQLLRSGLQLSVVLNLRSGAVDPAVVDLIGWDKVLAHDTLHAKIYWTDKGAIVGSCNASANGLGLVGTELDDGKLAKWKESAVFLAANTKPWRDAEVAVDTLMNEGSEINARMMAAAKLAWAQRRRYRPPPVELVSLAAAITGSPDLVLNRKVYLLLEEFADAGPPNKIEKAAMEALGVPLDQFDPWEGHVPLGMIALCFEMSTSGQSVANFKFGYASEIPDDPRARLTIKNEKSTLGGGWVDGASRRLERELGISFSKAADTKAVLPILRWLWEHRDEKWNLYRKRDWASVLVSLDGIVALLPRLATEIR